MLLRKINAIISLLATLFLLDHAIFISVWMLSRGSIENHASFVPWILAGLMAIHAFISIYLVVSIYMEGEEGKYKSYPKINRAALFQRISGVLLILFTALHIAGTIGAIQPPHIVHTILPPLFFALSLAHAAVSADKAFITLGIGDAKSIKVVSIIIKLICGATFIAAVTGFYLHVW